MKKLQYSSVCAVVIISIFGLLPPHAAARQLPIMKDQPWLGFFSGYERRGFEFGVNNQGQGLLYLLSSRSRERVGMTKTIKIYPEVLVENADGKLSKRRLKDDEGFATEMKPGLDHEVVKFTAETTGDAKVEITIKYDRDRIILDGKVLDPGDYKGKKIYFSYRVSVPAMYSKTYNDADEKKLKSAMRRDRIKFVRANDDKRISLKSYEEVDLADEKMAKGGVTSLEVALSGQEGKDFLFTTTDGEGVLTFDNRQRGKKGMLWKGYYVKWKRPYKADEAGAKRGNKPQPRNRRSGNNKPISPLVIEVK